MCKVAQKLMVLCESEETARSSLHQKILSIIFSGTLLTLLNAVEQSRRERDTINIPKFSPIIKHLSSSRGVCVHVCMCVHVCICAIRIVQWYPPSLYSMSHVCTVYIPCHMYVLSTFHATCTYCLHSMPHACSMPCAHG